MLHSVRGRLTVLFMTLMALLLAIFSGSAYFWFKKSLLETVDYHLTLHLRNIQKDFAEAYQQGKSPESLHVEGEIRCTIYDPKGAPVFSSSKTVLPNQPGSQVMTIDSGARMRTALVRTEEGDWLVAVALGQEGVTRELSDLRTSFFLFLPLFLLVSGISGYFVLGRALSPVEEIRRRAERISRSHLNERIPLFDVPGEFEDLARTFNDMLGRLERAFDDMQNFASDVAHELRTPLANLRATLETAIQGQEPPSDHLLHSFAEEIDRMTRIITDLLTLAKLDLRQYALQREDVSLTSLVEEVREIWDPVAQEGKIELTCSADEEEITVQGDSVALRRVLMNLVENAIKYNGPEGRVNMSLRHNKEIARIEVSDTGDGIPSEHLDRLFQRFYRVDQARARSTGGAGLGLAICKSFVEAHEGSILVRSKPGEGTTFTVELPLQR
ncbi:MAG: heavy metal sensor histidine kinase [Planctomycetota bacterium]|jgi:heavy metal sensor kinase|nr:heavy metal sensor histidine kinase [Planctomycetota bacterium]